MTTTVLEKPANACGTVSTPVKKSAKSEHNATKSERNFGIAKHTVVAINIKKTISISPNKEISPCVFVNIILEIYGMIQYKFYDGGLHVKNTIGNISIFYNCINGVYEEAGIITLPFHFTCRFIYLAL